MAGAGLTAVRGAAAEGDAWWTAAELAGRSAVEGGGGGVMAGRRTHVLAAQACAWSVLSDERFRVR